MGEYKGLMGGFFDQLGAPGVITMALSGAGYGFFHAYISAKIAAYMEVPVGGVKPELWTMGAGLVPPVAWMIARNSGYLRDTDFNDTIGNILGSGFLWELWNGVETLVMMMEEE